MNKERILINNQVIVEDENGEKKEPVEYYDNLDDVLVQENLIETMEAEIKKLEKQSESYKKHNRKYYFPIFLPIVPVAFIFAVSVLYLLTKTNPFTIPIETVHGFNNLGSLVLTIGAIVAIPLTSIMELSEYGQYKENKRTEKAVNSELDFLKKQIVTEKQILENLQQDKTNEKVQESFEVREVNDKEKLKQLRNCLNFYYKLGYDEAKFAKYYQQGKLDAKLQKQHCNSEGIALAKEYLEEKGHQLVNRKK